MHNKALYMGKFCCRFQYESGWAHWGNETSNNEPLQLISAINYCTHQGSALVACKDGTTLFRLLAGFVNIHMAARTRHNDDARLGCCDCTITLQRSRSCQNIDRRTVLMNSWIKPAPRRSALLNFILYTFVIHFCMNSNFMQFTWKLYLNWKRTPQFSFRMLSYLSNSLIS